MNPISLPILDAAADCFWHGYRGPADCFDEMVDAGGKVRPHWTGFINALDGLGLEEVSHRWEEARRLIRENGVTYNVYGDPHGLDRPWQLDPIPLMLPPDQWTRLERGLIQRAQVLELILQDLYGPQHLVRAGLVPPELVFPHPYFLRPCHGIQLPRNHYLHLYAADLGRSPDGSVWVLSDRTQAPSGAGYSLENRIVLSRMLPDVFHNCQVQRLSVFFRTVRENLASLAPRHRDNPRVVLLTPGPYNETYFEHAYLARYLGYTLVEGGDLTVRDERVYLKLLGGLQPVDVILRRLDDTYCDPLELRRDSFLGVPGLVQAVRAGNVALANPLGTGVLQTPVLKVFLPGICRHLLGEDLQLPSVPTFWCADPQSRQHVVTNLHRLVVKRLFPGPGAGRHSIFGEKLSREARQSLADQINARPRDFVAEEQLALSTAPVLVDTSHKPGALATGRFQPRHLVLRALLSASGDSFSLMPGGLTRFSSSAETLVVSLQAGGGSKDSWVMSASPVSRFSLLRGPGQPIELSRGGGDLPSRAADDLFWLGRYAERAEGMVRLLRGILARLTEKAGLTEAPELPLLFRALLAPGRKIANVPSDQSESWQAALGEELLSLVFAQQRPGSLAHTLASLRRVASTVRDRISLDTWRILHSLDLPQGALAFPHSRRDPSREPGSSPVRNEPASELQAMPDLGIGARGEGRGASEDPSLSSLAPRLSPLAPRQGPALFSDLLGLLNQMVLRLAAFAGLTMESMTRGHGWRFLDMGRRLERALQLVNLLRHTLARKDEGGRIKEEQEEGSGPIHPTSFIFHPSQEGPLLEAVLEIADSSMTYRRRYLAELQAAPVLDLLLSDHTNPRSLLFQMEALADHVEHLPRDQSRPHLDPEKRIVLVALTSLRLADIESLCQASKDGSREALDHLLGDMEKQLPAFCDTITRSYLSHVEPLQQRTAYTSPTRERGNGS